MTEQSVTFYFDYISPFAYFAWPRLGEIAARHGWAVTPRPVLFAGLLSANGNVGPAEIAAKRLYIFRNAQRLARDMDLPFRCPPSHPYNPLLSLRLTSAVEEPAQRARVVTALLEALWGRGQAIDTPGAVAAALCGLDLDVQALIERAGEPATKEALRAQTDEAIGRGVFGVPAMMAGEELFWGCDSLPHLDRHLAGEAPFDAAEAARWRDVPASASRRRE